MRAPRRLQFIDFYKFLDVSAKATRGAILAKINNLEAMYECRHDAKAKHMKYLLYMACLTFSDQMHRKAFDKKRKKYLKQADELK